MALPHGSVGVNVVFPEHTHLLLKMRYKVGYVYLLFSVLYRIPIIKVHTSATLNAPLFAGYYSYISLMSLRNILLDCRLLTACVLFVL